jgi:hypothetical protein
MNLSAYLDKGHVGSNFGYGIESASVYITERVISQQIFEGVYIQFFPEKVCSFGPYS